MIGCQPGEEDPEQGLRPAPDYYAVPPRLPAIDPVWEFVRERSLKGDRGRLDSYPPDVGYEAIQDPASAVRLPSPSFKGPTPHSGLAKPSGFTFDVTAKENAYRLGLGPNLRGPGWDIHGLARGDTMSAHRVGPD